MSMFNYTTITRIESNSSIKDCAVIINAFRRSYARALQASRVTLLLTEKMKENHGGAWKEEKDDREQEKSTDVSLKCLTAARSW